MRPRVRAVPSPNVVTVIAGVPSGREWDWSELAERRQRRTLPVGGEDRGRGQGPDSTAAHRGGRQNRRSLESEPVMPQLNLFVGGMSSRRCVRDVTARLRDVAGVETVTADLGDGVVRLTGSMQLADVLAAFTGTTYRPQLDGTSSGDSGQTAVGKSAP